MQLVSERMKLFVPVSPRLLNLGFAKQPIGGGCAPEEVAFRHILGSGVWLLEGCIVEAVYPIEWTDPHVPVVCSLWESRCEYPNRSGPSIGQLSTERFAHGQSPQIWGHPLYLGDLITVFPSPNFPVNPCQFRPVWAQ